MYVYINDLPSFVAMGQDLLMFMLEDKPDTRGSAAVVLEHPWMSVRVLHLALQSIIMDYCIIVISKL